MACIYLIQPKEYIGTDICKIGMSRKNDLQRVKSYGRGTRYLCVMECQNPFRLEKKIIEKFNDSFIKAKGNEYFYNDGNEFEMIMLFTEIVLRDKKIRNDIRKIRDEYECIVCQDTGTSYWGDGCFGDCFDCDVINKPCNTIKDYLTDSDSEDIESKPTNSDSEEVEGGFNIKSFFTTNNLKPSMQD
tara:strand:- start:81 stop:641 length:561 start_codon:yes stop_codon:yes gene_type:complete